nr:ABC transporter substrate-binding protein [Roseovarius sp. MMSF_3281]
MIPFTKSPFGTTRRSFILGSFAALLAPHVATAQQAIRIPHVWGETVLERPAERVVSLGYTTQDPLLALGVVPLAVRYWFGDQPHAVWPWAHERLGHAEPTVLTGEVSMELVAGLSPDLIVAIGSGISRAEYALLSEIAPVLMQGPDDPVFGTPWQTDTRRIARALGKAQQAEALIGDVEGQFESVGAAHPDWQGKTAAAAWQNGSETGAFMAQDNRARFLHDLGFRMPEKLRDTAAADGFYTTFSPEDISPIDADLLLWISSIGGAREIARLPMRRTLRAEQEGREVFADHLVSGALSFGSALSLPYALERLVGEVELALDGRPETVVPSALKAGLVR